jgi:chromosome partitioning protein
MRHPDLILAVVNLKGGTTKTTTAVHLAHALHERGRSVVLVDSDPQASAMRWCELAEEPFPFPVMQLATKTLYKQLPDFVRGRFEAVVIDTPPLEEQAGIVHSALRVATLALCPMAPTPIEYDRLDKVRSATDDVASLRADGEAVPLAVLLTRTVPNAASTGTWREQIEADGIWCLKAQVGRLERFSQAYGDNLSRVSATTAYGDALTELEATR